MYAFSTLNSITEIDADEWDAALPAQATPFLSYAFLSALEETGCVASTTGWQPAHLISSDRRVILPAYIKTHSYGEYVFDWSWAEAYANHGLDYYPKLLVGVPFTPVPGPRILGNGAASEALFSSLNTICRHRGLTGWHMNFISPLPEIDNEIQSMPAAEAPSVRLGCQFIWRNRTDEPYQSLDDYLATFVSRKRKSLLKERRRIREQGVGLTRLTGDQITADDIGFFYHCYRD
ncbi:MAG: peptidogalycan biosysnthesis protein, partial [Thalassolituus sp.]